MINEKYNLIAIIIWFFTTLILIELASTMLSLLTPRSTFKLLSLRSDYPNVIFIK